MTPWDEETGAKLSTELRQHRAEWGDAHPVFLRWDGVDLPARPWLCRRADAACLLDDNLSDGLGTFLAGAPLPPAPAGLNAPFWTWDVQAGGVVVAMLMIETACGFVALDVTLIVVGDRTVIRKDAAGVWQARRLDW